MKKMMKALCATAMLSMMFACSDKDNSEDNSRYDEGVYNPSKRIVSVDENNNVTNWIWENDLLARLEEAGGEGTVTEFVYDDKRVSKIIPSNGTFGIEEVTVVYSGRQIAEMRIKAQGRQVAKAIVSHNGEAMISHVDVQVDNAFVNEMAAFIDQLLDDITSLRKSVPSKLSVGTSAITLDFSWAETNVSQVYVYAHFTGTASGSEIAAAINVAGQYMDIPSSYATILNYLAADDELPFEMTIKDTVSMSYDNKKNPLCGFLGQIDLAMLSTNNIVEQTNRATVETKLTVTLPVIGDQTYTMPHTFDPKTTTYNYTYTADGYPLQVSWTEDEGTNTKTYTYAN